MGKYVYRKLLDTDKIVQWAKEQGLTHMLDPNDLHMTVIYSKVDFKRAPDTYPCRMAGGKRTISKFPAQYGNNYALVLEFDIWHLQQQHKGYLASGATSDYPTYKPHVTLTYKGGDIDISNIEPFKGKLSFSEEIQEPLSNESWEYKEIELNEIETLKIIERKMVLKLAGNMIDLAINHGKGMASLEDKTQAEAEFEALKTAHIEYELKK